MDLQGKNVMVTGANGTVGKALVKALLGRGAAKIYSAARTPVLDIDHGLGKVEVIKLDITVAREVAAAVRRCTDVDLLINSPGIERDTPVPGTVGSSAAREEIEINSFGTLGMCLAFAPVLASRGGGAIVNVCSSAGLVNLPLQGVYQVLLAGRNIRVVRAYPGLVGPQAHAGQQAGQSIAVPLAIAEAILSGVERELAEIPFISRLRPAPYWGEAELMGEEQTAANGW